MKLNYLTILLMSLVITSASAAVTNTRDKLRTTCQFGYSQEEVKGTVLCVKQRPSEQTGIVKTTVTTTKGIKGSERDFRRDVKGGAQWNVKSGDQ